MLPGDSTTRAAVQVGGVTVAIVNSATIVAIADADPDMDGAQPKSAAEAIIDALGKKNYRLTAGIKKRRADYLIRATYSEGK